MSVEFEGWPSISRLYRDMVVTEKIDGTNAAIVFEQEEGSEFYSTYIQSRKRFITVNSDNFGFASWVAEHETKLWQTLGPGRHFGEWWGSGIQRGYGLQKGERRFSLFNTPRWRDTELFSVPGLFMVPELYVGEFSIDKIEEIKQTLLDEGSEASPGFMSPEGVVIYHTASRTAYKSTYDDCDRGEGGKSWKPQP